MSWIQQLPKTELHRHLELSLRRSTIRELANQLGMNIDSDEKFTKHFLIMEPMKDLGAVLNKFLDTQKLLNTEQILERIAFEACEDAYKLENIRVLELRYAPTFIQSGHPHLTFEKIHEALMRGVTKAEAKYPIAVGMIAIIQRILPVSVAENVTDFVIQNKDTFIAIDLADNEVGFDSKPFAPCFHRAAKAGVNVTVHSGEANVPEAPRYIMDAIEKLGATRIGHGVQITKDPKVMDYVRDKKILLELCPTSNHLTQAVPEFSKHPFKRLHEEGILVSLNTDDPTIFNTDLNKECEIVVKSLGVSEAQLKKVFQNAFEKSFIPLEKRQKVWV